MDVLPSTAPELQETWTTIEVARRLGLAVRSVQLMVDRGELDAWRTPGGHRRISGASVARWLVAHQGSLLATGPGRPPVSSLGEGRGHVSAGTAARVLLIEDSAHYQNLVSLLFRQHFPDVNLQVASDGILGLAMVGRFDPDVLIVDILLPGIDGATLITSLRSHPQFSHCQLIVITSLGDAEQAPYAFALKDVPVVSKPRLVAELPALLARCFDKENASAPRPLAG